MTKLAIAGLVVTLLASTGVLQAQELPKLAAPQKEHEWLKQFAGEWESESEVHVEPGKPPLKCRGTESARSLGGFWIVAEGKSEIMGMPLTTVFTLGYDPEKKKYVGTWVDSVTSYLWKYEGTVDATGKVLTLQTEGPWLNVPGKLAKFKEVIELKTNDHKVFTSSVQGDDGQWTTFVTVNYRRKK